MKKNNQTLEVLEPEVEEIPLEQVIETTLVKHNVTDAVIATLKEKYGGMQLRSLDDKENYIDIKEARKEVRKVGIITEKLCKKGREDAIAIQKKWLSKEKEILSKISEVENPLNVEIEKFENEVERKELAEKKRQEEIYIHRQTTLAKLGATYDNGSFVLNHISYEVELLKQADNDMWEDTILPKYRKEFEAVEAQRVHEENKRKEEMELARKQREEFELQRVEFKKQQELFAQQQQELKKQMDDAEREKRLVQERAEAEAKQKRQQVIDGRIIELRGLGMTFNHVYNYFTFENINVDIASEVSVFTDTEWNALIEKITPDIEERRKVADQRKVEAQEKQNREAIQRALEDAELKKQQEEQRKQEELAKSGDKVKWEHFLLGIKGVLYPEMKSGIYRSKVGQAKEKIEEIIAL